MVKNCPTGMAVRYWI